MSFERYAEYAPTHVNWLDELPAHWGAIPLRRVAKMQSGEAITAESIHEEGDFPVYGGNGVRGFTSRYTHDGEFALIGRQGALCGNVNYAKGKFWASEHAVVCSPIRPLAARWFGELLRAMNLGQYSVAAAQPGLSVDLVGRIEIPLPPEPEQHAIAAFLDQETSRIDSLVAEQERLVALLREKRQAVIAHAAVKGLNNSVPMKASGVEWVGECPKHWTLTKLKYAAHFASGGTPSKERFDYWDGDVPWASSKDLKTESISDTQDHITQAAVDDGVQLVHAGDILVVVRGMILAHTFPVTIARVPMAINQDLKAIRPSADWNASYFATLLRASAAETLSRLDEAGHGTKALRMDAWLGMEIPKPPFKEQVAIAAYLEQETSRIDQLLTEARHAIDLLLERRTALIVAAVTGQIDVRPDSMRTAA